jgi:hypothetical protein
VINGSEKEQEMSPAASLYSSLSTHTGHGLLVVEFNAACFMVLHYAAKKRDEQKMYARNRKEGTGLRKSGAMTEAGYVTRGMPEKQKGKTHTVIWSQIGNKVVIMCAPVTRHVPRLLGKDYAPCSE